VNCLFCQIVNKTIKATICFEDEQVLAFEDINPQAPHHVLIVPKEHISTLNELNESNKTIIGHMTWVGSQLAKSLEIEEKGYRLVMNCNKGAGQTVFHLHMHLLGGRTLHWPPG